MKKLSTFVLALMLCLTSISQQPKVKVMTFLYIGNTLMDGTLSMFDSTYNDAVDDEDARKLMNFGENIAINRNGTKLAIERRRTYNTIPLSITNTRDTIYTLKITAEGTSAYFLEDKQEHKLIRVIDSLNYQFRGTANTDRFALVYCYALSLPDPGGDPDEPATTQVKTYHIYNILGQKLGTSTVKPTGAIKKVSETIYIKVY